MEIKVKEDELNQVKRTMDKDAEDLASSIEQLTQQLEVLRGIWQGQDADKFFGNARDYFEKMKGIPNCMVNMGRFIDRANGDFNEGDESFSKELMTEVDEQYIKEDAVYESSISTGKYGASGGYTNYKDNLVSGEYISSSSPYLEVGGGKNGKTEAFPNTMKLKGEKVSSTGSFEKASGISSYQSLVKDTEGGKK